MEAWALAEAMEKRLEAFNMCFTLPFENQLGYTGLETSMFLLEWTKKEN